MLSFLAWIVVLWQPKQKKKKKVEEKKKSKLKASKSKGGSSGDETMIEVCVSLP